jgi:hypothetical protein
MVKTCPGPSSFVHVDTNLRKRVLVCDRHLCILHFCTLNLIRDLSSLLDVDHEEIEDRLRQLHQSSVDLLLCHTSRTNRVRNLSGRAVVKGLDGRFADEKRSHVVDHALHDKSVFAGARQS